MHTILFATGNKEKFGIATSLCQPKGIDLAMFNQETYEIQSEEPKEVLLHKAQSKYDLAKQPIIVSDDSWEVPGLNGFPGPYMKSIDEWFTPQNFIDLMLHVPDKTINLHQYLAYQDKDQVKVFHHIAKGKVSDVPKGTYGKPIQKVVQLERDKGYTIAEVFDLGLHHNKERYQDPNNAWHQFIAWYVSDI